MALKKRIILPNGVEVNYHRINAIGFNKTGKADCMMLEYVSQEIREKNEKAYANVIHVPLITDGEVSYELAYTMLKNTERYKDAEDC